MWRNLLVNQLIFIARYQVHSGITLCSASFAFTLCPTPLLSTQTLQPHTEHAEADSSIVQLQVYIYCSGSSSFCGFISPKTLASQCDLLP